MFIGRAHALELHIVGLRNLGDTHELDPALELPVRKKKTVQGMIAAWANQHSIERLSATIGMSHPSMTCVLIDEC